MTEQLVPVRVRECPDGTHPEGDTVSILPTLPLEGGIQAIADFRDAAGDSIALMKRWLNTYVRYGAAAWTLHDPDGEVWPFDVERVLANFAWAWPVGDKANDLYAESVMDPLGLRSETSPGGPTEPTTSRPTTSTRKRRSSSSRRPSDGQPSPAPTG